MKRALVTGCTGQDGSYLSELLLSKGYEVHGIKRRSSSLNTQRLDHLYADPHTPSRFHLHYGDVTDGGSLIRLLQEIQPHEVYNLAAQSHVRVSFDEPEYTADVVALGTLRLLEALRALGMKDVRFYQASSSEMFGASPPPQSETTPFRPRSPYAVAKVFAHQTAVNYREAYGLHVSCGILFNHECIAPNTPLIVRRGGVIEVVRPLDLLPLRQKGPNVQTREVSGVEIWDGTDWRQLCAISAIKRRQSDFDHRMLSIEARAGVVEVTAHHKMISAAGEEIAASQVKENSDLLLGDLPRLESWALLSEEMAEFLGLMAAEGYVPERGSLQFTNCDRSLIDRVTSLWRRLFLGESRLAYSPSGFPGGSEVGQLYLTGRNSVCEWLRSQLYVDDEKRVPPIVLNASPQARHAFLAGYYAGDGLKAGNGESIKTSSRLLAQGVAMLYAAEGRLASVYAEHRGENVYFQLNIFSAQVGQKGEHLRKPASEVRRIVSLASGDDWVFDLETESGMLMAGVGRLVIHNSPRRGETFVTRKIAKAAARLAHDDGDDEPLYLGNLDALRDWGHARDYVEGMWRMLQQAEPDDYVLATGETHSVRLFADTAFLYAGRALVWVGDGDEETGRDAETGAVLIRIDPRYFRPTEVSALCGDPSKARTKLGWIARTRFPALVREMVNAEFAALDHSFKPRPVAVSA